MVQVWLSYASFEATPASMLGEDDQEGEGSEAERRQAAAKQEGPAAAADREAHARRSACHTHHQTATETSGMQGCQLALILPCCVMVTSHKHVCGFVLPANGCLLQMLLMWASILPVVQANTMQYLSCHLFICAPGWLLQACMSALVCK